MNSQFFLFTLVSGLAVSALQAQLLNETFTYGSGDLTTVSGGAWAAHSGAGGNPVQVNAGGAAVLRGGSAEDVNRTLTGAPYSDGTLWASFDLDFSFGTIAATGVNTYVLHFKDTSTGFRGRVFIGSSTAADTDLFRLGIENDAGDGGTAIFSSDLDRTSVHSVTVAYDITAGTSKLWVDAPSSGPATVQDTTPPTTVVASLSAAALRQGGGATTSGNYAGLQIDNLVVSHTAVPEPEEWAALAGAGLIAFGIWRRRR